MRRRRVGGGAGLAVSGARGVRGPAPPSPPPVPARRGPPRWGPGMAAIPSGGSLVATHDYYRRRLGSASGSSACGGGDCAGEAAPQRAGECRPRRPAAPPRPPAAEPGPWWASFFGRAPPAPAPAAPGLESPGRPQPSRASGGAGPGDSALEAVRKQPGRQPGQADPGPPS